LWPAAETQDWTRDETVGGIGLLQVVRRVHPTVLIGASAQGGAFTEQVIREMAAHIQRPIILPMSNPTPLAEATPTDLLTWTDGRALVATGSPFPPVTVQGRPQPVAQANNALIFPGLGLGVIFSRARRITDAMFLAAAEAVAHMVDPTQPSAPLLPQVADLRGTSTAVAAAVARAAVADGVATCDVGPGLGAALEAAMWQPQYRPVRAA